RSKLLEQEIPLLGVKFITPPHLRELLLAEDASALPLREHLRLLLAVAAESVGGRTSEDVDPAGAAASPEEALGAIAKSISRSPDNLLRAIDQVGTGGWNFQNTGGPAIREIIKEFQTLVRQCEFELVHEADREALTVAKSAPPRFNRLLLIGFT